MVGTSLLTIFGQRLPIPSTHIQLVDLVRKNLTEYILFKMLIQGEHPLHHLSMLGRGTIVRSIYLGFLPSSNIYCDINLLGEAARLAFVLN